MYNNFYSELYHYGIPEMQKGIRRFTNPDGTLNAAGKERYRNGKVGSGYTQARAAANKQRNSMNSQAALRMGPVSSSYVTDANRIKNDPSKLRRAKAAKAGAESASYKQAQVNAASARNKYRVSLQNQVNSMKSQEATGSARDRKRIDSANSRRTNLSNQLNSMNKQANIQRQKAVEAGRRGESEGIAKQKRKNAEARRIKIQKDKQQHAEERERLNREQFRRDIDNTIRAQNEINLEKKRRSRRR